jgi:hypothetical protein
MSQKVREEIKNNNITPLFGEEGPTRTLLVRDAYGEIKDAAPNKYGLLPALTV